MFNKTKCFILVISMQLTLYCKAVNNPKESKIIEINQAMAKREINVKDFGAKGDGLCDDSDSIQSALNAGGCVIKIPKGVYKIRKSLKINSNTTLIVSPDTKIILADHSGTNANVFLLTNSDFKNGNKNISIQGGVWDGNNAKNPRGREGDMNGYTGCAINFINVKNLEVKDLTVRNPEAFYIRICKVTNFVFENINFASNNIRPNQDGIHINGFCSNGIIRKIKALTPLTPNDDMVALNANDAEDKVINLGMKCGPINNIIVEDLQAESAYSFVRLLSYDEEIKNVTIRNVKGGCRYLAINMNRWRFPSGKGKIKNVIFDDFSIKKVKIKGRDKGAENVPLILIHSAVKELCIKDFKRNDSFNNISSTLEINNAQNNTIINDSDFIKGASKYKTKSKYLKKIIINSNTTTSL